MQEVWGMMTVVVGFVVGVTMVVVDFGVVAGGNDNWPVGEHLLFTHARSPSQSRAELHVSPKRLPY